MTDSVNDFEPMTTAAPRAPRAGAPAGAAQPASAPAAASSAAAATASTGRLGGRDRIAGAPGPLGPVARKAVTNGSAGAEARVANGPCWTTRPSRISTTTSARYAASPTSWVTSTTVLPSDAEDVAQVVVQLGADERVERAERLVEQQHLGVEHQRAHQADALALAARQLGRVAVEAVGGEAGQGAQLVEAARDAGGVPAEVARHQRRVVRGGEVREQPAVLDHVADAAAQRLDRVRRRAGPPSTRTSPGVGRDEPDQQAQQRRLAAARRAEQRGGLARREGELEVVDGDAGRRSAW